MRVEIKDDRVCLLSAPEVGLAHQISKVFLSPPDTLKSAVEYVKGHAIILE
jgi:hypothetical protein